MANVQDPMFGRRNTAEKPVESYTLANLHKPATQQIADLEWRIKFTKMKLNLWRDLENGQWDHLTKLHAAAIRDLKALAGSYSKSKASKNA